MIWLILGLFLWMDAHLLKSALPDLRAILAAKLGDLQMKGLIAVLLIASVWLMAKGYGQASAQVLWIAPGWMNHVAVLLMAPAFILFMGSYPGSALRSVSRHPQLNGFKLWATLHLIVNGDVRSLILFGGLLAWAVLSMILINRRDGKPPLPARAPNLLRAWACVPIGLIFWAVILGLHPRLFGVSPLG